MQILIHVFVLERILGRSLGGIDGGVEVLELACELHADFKWVGHPGLYS